jgi:hypothetical protein
MPTELDWCTPAGCYHDNDSPAIIAEAMLVINGSLPFPTACVKDWVEARSVLFGSSAKSMAAVRAERSRPLVIELET